MSEENFDIQNTAKLARLNLTDAECAELSEQMGAILQYVKQLEAVNVEGVQPSAQLGKAVNVLRPDEPGEVYTPEVALANAPQQRANQVVVPRVVE